MDFKVRFMSRDRAERFEFPGDSAIISISTPGNKFPVFVRDDVPRFNWHRADDSMPMTEDEVNAIYKFACENEHRDFFVHCDAGISRSAAVASFIGALFDRQVIGLDYPDVSCANAVIKSALMRKLWV